MKEKSKNIWWKKWIYGM